MGCATPFSSRPCPRHQPHRSSGTTRALSHSHPTSTSVGGSVHAQKLTCYFAYSQQRSTPTLLSVNAGEYIIVNKHLMKELAASGLWSEEMRHNIIANRGSIQSIDIIPEHTRAIFKTAWEISQRAVLDMSGERGAFICQSQSLNIHLDNPSVAKLTSLHFHAWHKVSRTQSCALVGQPKRASCSFPLYTLYQVHLHVRHNFCSLRVSRPAYIT
jgi:hypothetical protein